MFLFAQTIFAVGAIDLTFNAGARSIGDLPSIENLFIPQTQKLLAPDGASGDWYGLSVAISGNTLVVGAYNKRIGNNNGQGAAYVYVRNGSQWDFQQRLTANDGAFNDCFGTSVAISGDTIIVGATLDDNQVSGINHGSAYIFQRTGTVWTQQQKILPGDPGHQKEFGFSVAILGDTAFASARNDNNNFLSVSYVFERAGGIWTQKQKLAASDGQPSDGFGFAMALQENTAFLGSTSAGSSNQGEVYVFTKENNVWGERQILTANDGLENDYFGNSLSVSGNMLVVNAGGDDIEGINDRGSIYIFERTGNTWTQRQQIYNPNQQGNENFGSSLACSDRFILVGASNANVGQGTVYAFERSGSNWSEAGEITAADGSSGDTFGQDISLSDRTVVVGAFTDVVGSNVNQGSAYVFHLGSATPFDFDGDSKTDISIFRPSNGEWWYLKSSNGGNAAFQFGNSSDKLAPADFTGDGKTDIAVWRGSTGEWFVLRSEDLSYYSFPFGTSGDIPAPADFDGDAKADAAVFRPSTSFWYINRSTGGTTIQQFGQSGDVPVTADYDGDGKSDIAIFRPSVGEWWIQRSATGLIAFQFGNSADKPVQGDFTGDAKTDVAIWRPTGDWFVLRSEDQSYYSFPFGAGGDLPAPGDYDGDGKFDAGIFRPSGSTWYVQRSTAETLIQTFGTTGDLPVPNAFVP